MFRPPDFVRRVIVGLARRIVWRLNRHVLAEDELRHARKEERQRNLALTARNSELRNAHSEKRCFVLCNGPSVRNQDLRLLEGEFVISVSNGYHHPDFLRFRPRYHCVPQITYGKLTEPDVVTWFGEMHGHLGDSELFLSCTEEPLVKRLGMFPGRTVRYLYLNRAFDDIADGGSIDISRDVPGVQSVSIMCLMIAIYMGFREIYLLGTDHDQFKTGVYEYFYEPTVLRGRDTGADTAGRVLSSRYEEFIALGRLWQQYRAIKHVAERCGTRILNATHGGELDEFPRVKFANLFADKLASHGP